MSWWFCVHNFFWCVLFRQIEGYSIEMEFPSDEGFTWGDFPSDEEFTWHMQCKTQPQCKAQQPSLKWRELTIGVIYRIDKMKSVTTRYGPGTILELTTREDDKVEVWVPDRLVKDLGWSGLPRYVRPFGLVQCIKDTTKMYHKYELL